MRKEKLINRRQFFKKAAKQILPILAVASVPSIFFDLYG